MSLLFQGKLSAGTELEKILEFLKIAVPPLLAYLASRMQANKQKKEIRIAKESESEELTTEQAWELLARSYEETARQATARKKAEDRIKELEEILAEKEKTNG